MTVAIDIVTSPLYSELLCCNTLLFVDLESYAKNKVNQFSVIPPELSLWEISSLCSDVLEGAWYELYDNEKKSNKESKIKMLIRESIDNFQSTLVTECRVTITLAVLGSLGAGKSFFLNSLLNLGLPDNFKVKHGPLPSAHGDSQTPIPIYVKNGRKVQVLFNKQEVDPNPDEWFREEEMGIDTLGRVNSTLLTRFQDKKSFTSASYVVLQGPFPVFTDGYLKTRQMTRQGLGPHLELEVDVQFVDVPGFGDNTGNEAISGTLSKADVVLFFDGGRSGRKVSAEDIAHLFRRREGPFEFVSRPKLVHIFNDRSPSPPPLDVFRSLCEENEKKLGEAWSTFQRSIREKDGIYTEARKKLPKLNSDDLLEKLSVESKSIYFHPQSTNFLTLLKNVVDEHVRSVKVKQMIHPFLQSVYWAATMLRKRVVDSLYTRTKKGKFVGFDVEEVIFEMLSGVFLTEESQLITSFLKKASQPLELDIESLHDFLYSNFLLSSETRHFLAKVLKKSLESYTSRLIAAFCNSNLSILEDVPKDILELTEMVCITRVKQFCASVAPTYLLHFLRERKNQISLPKDETLDWARASSDEDKSKLVRKYLHLLLYRAEMSLQDNRTRKKQASRTSHFQLMKMLEELVGKLLPASSFQDAYRMDCLESLKEKLPKVIFFCKDTIREINPHPKLDVRAVPSLPKEMTNAKENDKIPSQSSHEKIIREVTRLLLNPGKKKAKDIIREMETKLKFKRGYLELQQPHNADQRLWALALVHVLSDKEHCDIPVSPEIVFDPTGNETLLSLARERLFAHQKSSVFCKIVKTDDKQPIPEDEIHLKTDAPKKCIEALVSSGMHNTLDSVCAKFRDPSQQLVPVFIPITRPGHTRDVQGNYFLDEDPWRKASPVQEESGEEKDGEERRDSNQGRGLELNIFLVVEPHHLEKLKSTINNLRYPPENDVKLMCVVLPQKGRGIGVTKSIIKSLAECLKFSLYWTIDDNIQFMYRFVEDDRRWHKCPLTSGLLFGQRVFQSCLKKAIKDVSREDRDDLFDEATEGWEKWAKQPLRDARELLLDGEHFSELQKDLNLLHSPFANISDICGGDPDKEVKLMGYEREFVAKCRKKLFEDTINHISGISLAHVRSKGSDLMSRYPKADYMRPEQLSQVVLNNGYALKGKNFVSDEVILLDEELQIYDGDRCNDPYWGIKGSEDSFRRALLVSGVAGYRVIRIVYKDKKLRNAFGRPSSYFTSEDDDVDEDVDMAD